MIIFVPQVAVVLVPQSQIDFPVRDVRETSPKSTTARTMKCDALQGCVGVGAPVGLHAKNVTFRSTLGRSISVSAVAVPTPRVTTTVPALLSSETTTVGGVAGIA